MKGLEDFYLTTYESALEMIDDLYGSKLKIPKSEYNKIYNE